MGKFLEGLEAIEAVIETGRSSFTMVDVLEEIGVTDKIAHPNEAKAIARAKIKTDKRDSGVETVVTHHHLDLDRDMRGHPGDEFQIIHRLLPAPEYPPTKRTSFRVST